MCTWLLPLSFRSCLSQLIFRTDIFSTPCHPAVALVLDWLVNSESESIHAPCTCHEHGKLCELQVSLHHIYPPYIDISHHWFIVHFVFFWQSWPWQWSNVCTTDDWLLRTALRAVPLPHPYVWGVGGQCLFWDSSLLFLCLLDFKTTMKRYQQRLKFK